MGILLSTLVTELQSRVVARNSSPSAGQYEKAVKDAADDFGQRCSREKIGSLNIVSGQAVYDLPADFIRLIQLYTGPEMGGVIISEQGLIPVPPWGTNAMRYERYTFSALKMTIYPTPNYTLERTLRYAAGWALTDTTTPTYEEMLAPEAAIVLLKAEAECLTLQLNVEGGGVMAYTIGDESFSKAGGAQVMLTNRDARKLEYLAACDAYNGMLTVYGGGF